MDAPKKKPIDYMSEEDRDKLQWAKETAYDIYKNSLLMVDYIETFERGEMTGDEWIEFRLVYKHFVTGCRKIVKKYGDTDPQGENDGQK